MKFKKGNNGSDRSAEEDNSDSEAGGDTEPSTGEVAGGDYARQGTGESAGLMSGYQRISWPSISIRDEFPTPERSKTDEGYVLETVEQQDPLRVWRGLNISTDGNNVGLESVNNSFGKFLAVEQEAICNASKGFTFGSFTYAGLFPSMSAGPSKPDWTLPEPKPVVKSHAPAENCSCGFYGVKDKDQCMGTFIAEADFYGKVIEHEIGYRAQFQRVLSVRVTRPTLCFGTFLCDGRPELVWFRKEGKPLVICAECAKEKKRAIPLSKLAARLGVEVRWDS